MSKSIAVWDQTCTGLMFVTREAELCFFFPLVRLFVVNGVAVLWLEIVNIGLCIFISSTFGSNFFLLLLP